MKLKIIRITFLLIILIGSILSSFVWIRNQKEQSQRVVYEIPAYSSPVPIVTSESTNSSTAFAETTCWPIKILEANQNIPGSLVFSDFREDTLFWDLSSFRAKTIETARGFTVNSGGDTLYGMNPDEPSIIKISNTKVENFQLPPNTYAGMEFLADGKIFIQIFDDSLMDNHLSVANWKDDFIIFDPTASTLTSHSVPLDNLWLSSRTTYALQYSPNLRYAVYQTEPQTQNDQEHPRFILYDLLKHKIVWNGPDLKPSLVENINSMPVWLPDSSSMIYSITSNDGDNFYSISLTGAIEKITSLRHAKIHGISLTSRRILVPSLSPDGRYIVFQVEKDPQFKAQVLDNQTNNINDKNVYIWDNQSKLEFKPCLPEEDTILDILDVFWSVDGKYFFIQSLHKDGERASEMSELPNHATISIIDLANQVIYKLPDEKNRGEYASKNILQIIGWVNWEIP